MHRKERLWQSTETADSSNQVIFILDDVMSVNLRLCNKAGLPELLEHIRVC